MENVAPMVRLKPAHQRAKSAFAATTLQSVEGNRATHISNPGQCTFRRLDTSPHDLVSALMPKPLIGEVDAENVDPEIRANVDIAKPIHPGLHKRSRSARSLKALVSASESKPRRSKKDKTTIENAEDKPKQLSKPKSSTGLSTMFAKLNRSSKDLSLQARDGNHDEHGTPLSGSHDPGNHTQFTRRDTRVQASEASRPKSSGTARPRSLMITASKDLSDMLSRNRRPPSAHGSDSSCASKADVGLSRSRSLLERMRNAENSSRKTSGSSTDQIAENHAINVAKRGSRVMAAVAAYDRNDATATPPSRKVVLDAQKVNDAFETVLTTRNIPEDQRIKMRTLTLHVKADFVRQDETTRTCSPDKQIADKQFADCEKRYDLTPSKIETDSTISDQRSSRPRSRTFTFTKGDVSPGKRLRSAIRPQSINGNVPKRDASRSPEKRSGSSSSAPKNNPIEFVRYLKSAIDPTKAEVGRIHKLRLILRNETVAWVDDFIRLGGMTETIEFLRRIMQMQWREEHEDQLLHETLRCLRGLCMTTVALAEFDRFADQLLPELMAMLFDVGKKGPSEYNTRVIVFNLMLAYLTASVEISAHAADSRAKQIMRHLQGPLSPTDMQHLSFVTDMRTRRPYKLWCKEASNVVKEVFWIFLHHDNIVSSTSSRSEDGAVAEDLSTYQQRHFPRTRAPVPAAPYIGGVEWDATTYLTAHLDLINGLIAALESKEARNEFRADLRTSGLEKLMGDSLRTCKEKFYAGVHDALRAWAAAANDDGWDTTYVCFGPSTEERAESAIRALQKSKSGHNDHIDVAPRLDVLQVDLGFSSECFS